MKDFAAPPQMPLRPPSDVMRLARMGGDVSDPFVVPQSVDAPFGL